MSRCTAGFYFDRLLASRRCWPLWAPGVGPNGPVQFLSGDGSEGHLLSSCSLGMQPQFISGAGVRGCMPKQQTSLRPGPAFSPAAVGQGLVATHSSYPGLKGCFPATVVLDQGQGLSSHHGCPGPHWGQRLSFPVTVLVQALHQLTLAALVWRRGLQGEGSGLSCRGTEPVQDLRPRAGECVVRCGNALGWQARSGKGP